MTPHALPQVSRRTPAMPTRPTVLKPVPMQRQSQVLQTGREPAQLSLFPRPNGKR